MGPMHVTFDTASPASASKKKQSHREAQTETFETTDGSDEC